MPANQNRKDTADEAPRPADLDGDPLQFFGVGREEYDDTLGSLQCRFNGSLPLGRARLKVCFVDLAGERCAVQVGAHPLHQGGVLTAVG